MLFTFRFFFVDISANTIDELTTNLSLETYSSDNHFIQKNNTILTQGNDHLHQLTTSPQK